MSKRVSIFGNSIPGNCRVSASDKDAHLFVSDRSSAMSRVAHASRVLVSASRRNNLPRKVRESGTLSPRETRALPGINVHFTRGTRDTNSCDALNSPINVSELTPILAPVPATILALAGYFHQVRKRHQRCRALVGPARRARQQRRLACQICAREVLRQRAPSLRAFDDRVCLRR